jgi:hypothetical protein
VSWTDRVSGRTGAAPAGLVAVGQWRWDGPGALRVRHALATAGQALVPGPDGRFQAPELGDVRADPATVPDPDAWRSLRVMAQGVKRRQGQTWLEWLDEPPLMPPLDDTLDETELEQVAKARLGDMETACRQPRTLLHLEEERQIVARCHRPSQRAPMVLAARTEDWERRTLWGIRPKRVLGLVRDELFDLYENRLVVGLVDRLDEALTQRVREVRRIVQAARSMGDWQKTLVLKSNHRRAARICTLWGELWANDGLLARASGVLKRLLQLRQRVLALKDSVLYRKVGGRNRTIQLRMTNVLTHDDTYRGIVELWLAWERHSLVGKEDAQARWERDQQGTAAFELFGVLLVIRAFEALHMEPTDRSFDAPIRPGASIDLSGPAGRVTLRWNEDHVLVTSAERAPLRIVTLPAMLEAAAGTAHWLQQLDAPDVLILHLAAEIEQARRVPEAVRVRLNGPGPTERPAVLVPVAPWELESVERVARALRWLLWGPLLNAYPRRVLRPPGSWALPARSPEWLATDGGALAVLEPSRGKASWSELDQRVTRQEAEVSRLDRRLEELDPKDTRKQRDRLYLRQEREVAASALSDDRAFRESLAVALERTAELLACPSCTAVASPHGFSHAGGRSFRVVCAACESSWGLRDCRSCNELFPFISCPDIEPGASPLDVDRSYGCDVLAFPVEEGAFTCTKCGRRSDGADVPPNQ